MSTTESILRRVKALPRGKPFSVASFSGYGSREAVDQAFCRLVKRGVLSRVTRGVYVRPKLSPYVGQVPPEPMEVARVLAAETNSTVQVNGAEAVRRLGLSTQVPTRPVFLTNGPGRRFQLGALSVELKHVHPNKVALADRPAGLALTALWYLGKDAVSMATLEQVRSRLPEEEFEVLRKSERVMPGWMRNRFREYAEAHPID